MSRIIGLIIPEETVVAEPAETAPPEAPETEEDAEPAETAPSEAPENEEEMKEAEADETAPTVREKKTAKK